MRRAAGLQEFCHGDTETQGKAPRINAEKAEVSTQRAQGKPSGGRPRSGPAQERGRDPPAGTRQRRLARDDDVRSIFRRPKCTGENACATGPLDGTGGRGCRDRFGADAQHLALISFDYFEAQAVGIDYFAGAGDVTGYAIEQAGNGGGGGMLHARIELYAEKFADFF